MKSLEKGRTKRVILYITSVLILSLGLNTYLLFHRSNITKIASMDIVIDTDQKIKDIEKYLDSISSSYVADEQFLAKQDDIDTWGCGPSSYALAKILNKKFFNNKLVINASYNNKNPNEIIERFSLARNKNNEVVDHGWLEIYLGDKFLFVDPSIGQFGKTKEIVYREFEVGDQRIRDILNSDYGIEDIRLSLLVPKIINRVPTSQEPYPGITIDEGSIDYFLKVLDDRNSVNDGVEPSEWKDWVSFLTDKYS